MNTDPEDLIVDIVPLPTPVFDTHCATVKVDAVNPRLLADRVPISVALTQLMVTRLE